MSKSKLRLITLRLTEDQYGELSDLIAFAEDDTIESIEQEDDLQEKKAFKKSLRDIVAIRKQINIFQD